MNFHARFSEKQRIYKYVILNRLSKPSIEKERGWHIIKKLDVSLMKKGAKNFWVLKIFLRLGLRIVMPKAQFEL